MSAIPAQLARGISRQVYVRVLRVNVTEADLIALDRLCRAYKTTVSDLVRHLIRQYAAQVADAVDAALGETEPGGDDG